MRNLKFSRLRTMGLVTALLILSGGGHEAFAKRLRSKITVQTADGKVVRTARARQKLTRSGWKAQIKSGLLSRWKSGPIELKVGEDTVFLTTTNGGNISIEH